MRNSPIKSFAQNPFLILAFSIVTFFTNPIYGQELSGEQKEIWKMEEKLWDTWKKKDGRALRAFYHKDAIIWGSSFAWPQDRTHVGTAGYYDSGSYNSIESFKLILHEIKNFGNCIVVQYNVEMVSYIKKHNRFRISNSWMKQNGKWVIIGSMYSSCSILPKCPE